MSNAVQTSSPRRSRGTGSAAVPAARLREAVRAVSIELLESRTLLAGAGVYDPTFGTDGLYSDNWPQAGNDVLVEPGGKFIVFGAIGSGQTLLTVPPAPPEYGGLDTDWAFSRYTYVNDAVTPDISIAWNWHPSGLPGPYASDEDIARAGAYENWDNKIIIAGTDRIRWKAPPPYPTPRLFALSRHFYSGSLDPSLVDSEHPTDNSNWTPGTVAFEAWGRANGDARVNDLAIWSTAPNAASTKYYIGGAMYTSAYGWEFAIVRMNYNGSPDTTFGNGGLFLTHFDSSFAADEINQIVVNQDGSLVFVGYSDTATWDTAHGHKRFIIGKVKANGTMDTSFNSNGWLELADFGGKDAVATGAAMDAKGNIIVGGNWDNFPTAAGMDTAIAVRITPTGAVDPTFGRNGIATAPNDSVNPFTFNVDDAVLQPDGKVVLGGTNNGEFAVARFNVDGSVDTDFTNTVYPGLSISTGANVVDTDQRGAYATTHAAVSLAFQADYKIVTVGQQPFGGTAGAGFVVGRVLADDTGPTAELAAEPVTSQDGTLYRFAVTFQDNVLVDAASITAAAVTVTVPDSVKALLGSDTLPVTLASITPGTDAKTVIAVFQITPPGGDWDTDDNGFYRVTLNAGEVLDTFGNPAAARDLGGFDVRADPPDQTAPVATPIRVSGDGIELPNDTINIIAGGRKYHMFVVQYADPDDDVVASSLGDGNIRVLGPAGYNQAATFLGVDKNTDGSPRYATYRITAPNGVEWTANDNGIYYLAMQPNQVRDSHLNYAGNNTAGNIGQFNVKIEAGRDVHPTAALTPIAGVAEPGSTLTLVVTYTKSDFVNANVRMDAATLFNNSQIVRVTAPADPISGRAAFDQFATFETMEPLDGNGAPRNEAVITVTYTVAPGDGSWDLADNGTYTVQLVGNKASDTDTPANFVRAVPELGKFNVNIPQGPAVQLTSSVTPPTLPTTNPINFTLTFHHASGLNLDSIRNAGDNLITVTNNATGTVYHAHFIAFVDSSLVNGATDADVDYELDAPGGLWDPHDNGDYTIAILGDLAASIDGGKTPAQDLGTFRVSVSATSSAGPTAELLTVPPEIVQGGTDKTFSVRFTDTWGVNVSLASISNDGVIQVTGPSGFSAMATFVSATVPAGDGTYVPATGDADVILATYRIGAPGGIWDGKDYGTYIVSVVAGTASDDDSVSPNYVAAGPVINGNFSVFIGDPTGSIPTATLTPIPDVNAPDTGIVVTVTFQDALGVSAASLLSNNQVVQVTNDSLGYSTFGQFLGISDQTDGTPRVVSYWVPARGGRWDVTDNGSYTVSLQPDQVSNTGAGLNAGATLGTFTVNVAPWSLSQDGALVINGTDDNETLRVVQNGTLLHVTMPTMYNGFVQYVEQTFDLNTGPQTPVQADYYLTSAWMYGTTSLPGNYLPGQVVSITSVTVNGWGGDDVIDLTGVQLGMRLKGGAGNDTLIGGDGNDTLLGNAGADVLMGGAGDDVIRGNVGDDTLRGGKGNDMLLGGGGANLLRGQAGLDTLVAGTGPDTLYGNRGSDTIYARNGAADIIDGGAGTNAAQVDDLLDPPLNVQILLA